MTKRKEQIEAAEEAPDFSLEASIDETGTTKSRWVDQQGNETHPEPQHDESTDRLGGVPMLHDMMENFERQRETAIPDSIVTFEGNLIHQHYVSPAVETLTASGIITDADNGHRPVFRNGHLEHLAREYVRLGKQEAWRLYQDDLTVVFAFYAEEFNKLVCEAVG